MLNTQVLFLRKDAEPICKLFSDDDWTPFCIAPTVDEQSSPLVDVPEAVVISNDVDMPSQADAAEKSPPKVRPIQMGEFLRKYVSRRLLALSATDITRIMVSTRQLGVGTSGGAEALAIFHQLVYGEWIAGGLRGPLARIKIDEKNCFGMLEWGGIRKATRRGLPRHWAVTSWKHAQPSFVEQAGVCPLPKDRGAEQGDVDGPLECSLTLAEVASETRMKVAELQRNGTLAWCTEGQLGVDEACIDHDSRKQKSADFDRDPREDGAQIDPKHSIQINGGLADYWYLDDGDILCDPSLVAPYLEAFDQANPCVGGERNVPKTEVIYYACNEDVELRGNSGTSSA
jgi:hypothetical protein